MPAKLVCTYFYMRGKQLRLSLPTVALLPLLSAPVICLTYCTTAAHGTPTDTASPLIRGRHAMWQRFFARLPASLALQSAP